MWELCRNTCMTFWFGVDQKNFEQCMCHCNTWFVSGEALEEEDHIVEHDPVCPSKPAPPQPAPERVTWRQRMFELCRDVCIDFWFGVNQHLFEDCFQNKCAAWFVSGETPAIVLTSNAVADLKGADHPQPQGQVTWRQRVFELCRDTCIYFFYGVQQQWFEQCFGDCGKWFVSGAEEPLSIEMESDNWPSQDTEDLEDAEKKTFRQRLYELCRDTCQEFFFGVQQ